MTARTLEPARPGLGAGLANPVVVFGGCALVGAGVWGAWLGWDTSFYAGSDDPYVPGPHLLAREVACAVTVGLATALLARWRNPMAVAGGVTWGIWVIESALAAVTGGPLWIVTSVIVLCALLAITALSAALGDALRAGRTPAPPGLAPPTGGRLRAVAADLVEGLARDPWQTGTALTLVGGCWLLIGAVVRHTHPLTWTYLEILRFPLDALAAAAVITGIVLAIEAAQARRALGRPLRPLARTVILNGALLLVVLIGRMLPAGDGFDGQVGVMASPEGTPVAVLGVCQGAIDSVSVEDFDSPLADEAFERGEVAYAARLHHQDGVDQLVLVDLSTPPAEWSGTALRPPAAGEEELYIAASGRESKLNEIWFTRAEVEQLAPGDVLHTTFGHVTGPWAANEQVPLQDFLAVACASGRGNE